LFKEAEVSIRSKFHTPVMNNLNELSLSPILALMN